MCKWVETGNQSCSCQSAVMSAHIALSLSFSRVMGIPLTRYYFADSAHSGSFRAAELPLPPAAGQLPLRHTLVACSLTKGSELPTAAAFEGWQDAPVLLRLKPGLQQRCSSQDKLGRIPLNSKQ